ncbi:MAG: hypothetical protein OXG81_13260 [Acidobacteria bacterium]|nr:hypothetical protein [Acidobacteriota bacterium]
MKLVQSCYGVFTLGGLPTSFIPDRSPQCLGLGNLLPTGQLLKRPH